MRSLLPRFLLLAAVYSVACVDPVEERKTTIPDVRELAVPEMPACSSSLGPETIDTVASGLEIPWDVAFLADGRALITERPGRIRVVGVDGNLAEEPWAEIEVFASAEAGLLGIDVAPIKDGGAVTVYVSGITQELGSNPLSRIVRAFSRRVTRAIDPERGHARYQKIFRLVERSGSVSPPEVVIQGIPAAPIHAGGVVRFAPDGSLLITNGDGAAPETAQDPESLRGKILRYEMDGSVPRDNPFPESPVWATGVRNVQGIDWHPETGDLFAIDHGPTGLEREDFRTDEDELNTVASAANLGWPLVTGPTEGEVLTSPVATWRTAIAPAALAIYDVPGSPWFGHAFVTGLRGASLRRIELVPGAGDWTVACEEVLLPASYGRLRLLRVAPDSTLWVGTSNRDQNGLPREGSDLILRLHPPD